MYKNIYAQTSAFDSAFPKTEERALQPRFGYFGIVRHVITKVAGISSIQQLQLLLLPMLRNMMGIILSFMRYRYEQKEKLISLIVLVCLVLLVTVIGYQKYHENIRPTKESSPSSTVETETINSQTE
ncbi:hypothetical protein NWO25_18155 [Enterococcus lactis]|nr:hypothetical protein [Enterococcus lactis]